MKHFERKQIVAMLSIAGCFVPAASFAQPSNTEGKELVFSVDDGIKIGTRDKSASFQVGGRLQWDYTHDETRTDGVETTTQDFDRRRARTFFVVRYEDFELKSEFNIGESGSDGSAEDLYIRYKGFGPLATLTVGKQNLPFGLDRLNSSNDMPLLERSAMTERFAFDRSAGLQLSGKTKQMTYGLGVFESAGDGADDFNNVALASRVTWTPVNSPSLLLHLGAGAAAVGASDPADEQERYNLELAGTYGAAHWQGEYFGTRQDGGDLSGYYLQAGYVLTGQTRPYKDGKFGRLKPTDGGIWEAVARWEEGDGRFSDLGLGRIEGEQIALGLNYYPHKNVRLGVSYMTGQDRDSSDRGEELRFRTQFTF